jgi:hypothetical protein
MRSNGPSGRRVFIFLQGFVLERHAAAQRSAIRGTLSACPFAEGSLREAVRVTLSLVHFSQDYQCQLPFDVIVAVYLLRNGLRGLSNAVVIMERVSG